MPSAEIITIGTEILLGDIKDTNSQKIAQYLKEIGVDIFRVTTVGDNVNRIIKIIQEAMQRCDIIITTGGLGPTVDDPTREAIAQALGVDLEYHLELWHQILDRFQRFNRQPTSNNERQAYIPQNAIPIENKVGTAPAFICQTNMCTIIALPGVPMEMDYLMQHEAIPFITKHFKLNDVILSRILHTVGAGESQIDTLISDFESLNNPTVGLAAHSGQVDIRITVKAKNKQKGYSMISPIENEIRTRLRKWVYGADDETLESIALNNLNRLGWKLTVVEAGLNGFINHRLAKVGTPYIGGLVLKTPPTLGLFPNFARQFHQDQGADITIGISNYQNIDKSNLLIFMISPNGEEVIEKPYGGPPEYVYRWAFHHSLDILRRL